MTYYYALRNAVSGDVPRLAELLIRMDAHVAGIRRDILKPTQAGLQDIEDRLAGLIDNPQAQVVVATGRAGIVVAMGDVQVWHCPDMWENPERRGRIVGGIDDIWVEPKHRRRGLNRRIVTELVEFARSRGVQELCLEYSMSNIEAAGTWSRLGFQPAGVRASASPEAVLEHLTTLSTAHNQESS